VYKQVTDSNRARYTVCVSAACHVSRLRRNAFRYVPNISGIVRSLVPQTGLEPVTPSLRSANSWSSHNSAHDILAPSNPRRDTFCATSDQFKKVNSDALQ
jgi:hypothetical protein